MTHRLPVWVVYENPSDYPGKFVVRVQYAERNGSVTADSEARIADTLDEARCFIPGGLVCLPRYADDDPVIVEAWV